MTVLALAEFRRPREPRAPRGQAGQGGQVAPPVSLVKPPMLPIHAVPGNSSLVMAINAGAGSEIVSMTQQRDHHTPGVVACWVTCLVCEARFRHDWTPAGVPIYEGGLIIATVRDRNTKKPVQVAVACRCAAGQAMADIRPATDVEYTRAIARRKVLCMRGLRAMSDSMFMEFIIGPRDPAFRANWEALVAMSPPEVPAEKAWRRAFIKQLWRWQR